LLGYLRPRNLTTTTTPAAPPAFTETDEYYMATPEQAAEALLNHQLEIDGEKMSFQNWFIRVVRSTRGVLKRDELLTAADKKTVATVGQILANAGADVRAIKT